MSTIFNPFTGTLDFVGSASVTSWKDPVATPADLPNTDGDGTARVVKSTDHVYVFDITSGHWQDTGLTVAAFSNTATAAGISIDTSTSGIVDTHTISLHAADATNPGAITAGTQTIGGNKTFTGSISASNLSGTNTGDVTFTSVGSSPNSDAASLSGQAITLQPADSTNPGVLTSGTQTIGGNKTFTGTISSSNFSGSSSGTNTGDVSLTAVGSSPNANGASLSGQALTLQPANTSFPGVLTASDWNTFNNKVDVGNYVTDPTAVVAGQGTFDKNAAGTPKFILGYADGTKFSSYDAMPVNTALFMSNVLGSQIAVMSQPPPPADTTSSSGIATLSSGSVVNTASTGVSNFVQVNSGANFGLGATGASVFISGDISNASNSASTGIVQLFSGRSSGTGNSGAITLKSGNKLSGAAGGTTGTLTLATGSIQQATLTGVTGAMAINTGASNGTGTTGALTINTGNNTNATSGGSGVLTAKSGTSAGSTATGVASFGSGNATGTGNSGVVNLTSGNSTSGSTGGLNLLTGNGGVNSGSIAITTGTAGTSRGDISLSASNINITAAVGVVNFNTAELRNVVDPTLAQSAVTKNYADNNYLGRSAGDINQTSFSLANNQSSAADVTGLVFANANVRSFESLVSVFINATSSLYEVFHLSGIQKGSSWDMAVTSNGDSSLVTFSITNAGQVQYTSANYSGFVSGTVKFRAITTAV